DALRPALRAHSRAPRHIGRRTGHTSPPGQRTSSDALRLGVDVDAAATDEAAERDAAVSGKVYGECAGRSPRDHDGAARHSCLLHELEGEAAAHAEDLVAERQEPSS